jgi:hypothetical protein
MIDDNSGIDKTEQKKKMMMIVVSDGVIMIKES